MSTYINIYFKTRPLNTSIHLSLVLYFVFSQRVLFRQRVLFTYFANKHSESDSDSDDEYCMITVWSLTHGCCYDIIHLLLFLFCWLYFYNTYSLLIILIYHTTIMLSLFSIIFGLLCTVLWMVTFFGLTFEPYSYMILQQKPPALTCRSLSHTARRCSEVIEASWANTSTHRVSSCSDIRLSWVDVHAEGNVPLMSAQLGTGTAQRDTSRQRHILQLTLSPGWTLLLCLQTLGAVQELL